MGAVQLMALKASHRELFMLFGKYNENVMVLLNVSFHMAVKISYIS